MFSHRNLSCECLSSLSVKLQQGFTLVSLGKCPPNLSIWPNPGGLDLHVYCSCRVQWVAFLYKINDIFHNGMTQKLCTSWIYDLNLVAARESQSLMPPNLFQSIRIMLISVFTYARRPNTGSCPCSCAICYRQLLFTRGKRIKGFLL